MFRYPVWFTVVSTVALSDSSGKGLAERCWVDMTIASAAGSTHPYHRDDISAPEFWDQDFQTRDKTFAELRATDGLTWHPPVSSIFPHTETGYWAVTRHADIKHVSQNSDVFISSEGIAIDPMPAELQRATTFFLTMDPPEHTRYRRLISAAFTPRQVRRIEEQIRGNAKEIVDELLAKLRAGGEVDFVAECAAKLPMRTISDMIGIEPADRASIAAAAEALSSASDDEYASLEDRAMHMMSQFGVLTNAGIELAQRRREDPREDLMTNIVQAEVDGHRLSDAEVGAFLVLLSVAGNDTTKQTTTHAFKALIEHPDQRAWLLADFDDRINLAVDELVRWATPVLSFARHAATDTELAGTQIAAGEKLALFYGSANRDAAVFDRPGEFDITRTTNPHFGFGGGGTHFCLGSQLARMELRQLFFELLTRLPEVTVGEPELLHSMFIHGVKRLPMSIA
jgi:cytochrome P450